jgi:hypothetical protein
MMARIINLKTQVVNLFGAGSGSRTQLNAVWKTGVPPWAYPQIGCRDWIRTSGLQVMNLTRYYFSTRLKKLLVAPICFTVAFGDHAQSLISTSYMRRAGIAMASHGVTNFHQHN